eukprot:936213-Amphidinium_carterae.1
MHTSRRIHESAPSRLPSTRDCLSIGVNACTLHWRASNTANSMPFTLARLCSLGMECYHATDHEHKRAPNLNFFGVRPEYGL